MKFGDLSDVDLSVSSHRGLHFWIFWGIRLLMNPNHVLLNLAPPLLLLVCLQATLCWIYLALLSPLELNLLLNNCHPLPQLLLRSQVVLVEV